ncbi:hypothetical protein [Kistimonas asteriae]|uniref:hypothetical protein n=1 Tax=Kistimonas asteriae TaxID=517724 RepID=UPI001BAC79C4|nr:hypothetical protein [Kistimonas asteriae]
MTATYDLIFSGETNDDVGEAQVRKNVAALFKASPAQVEKLFSGKTVVLKNGLDEATAKKYQAALKKAGAVCQLRPKQSEKAPAPQPEPSPAVAPEPKPSPEPSASDKTQISTPEAGISVEPAGTDVQDKKPEPQYDVPDTSNISLRPQSGYLVDPAQDEPPPAPDTSHITLDSQD